MKKMRKKWLACAAVMTVVIMTVGILPGGIGQQCGRTVLAAESETNTQTTDRQMTDTIETETTEAIGVYSTAIYQIEGELSDDVEDGKATVKDEDSDVTITVKNAPSDVVRLVIVPIPRTETSAWKWIGSAMDGHGTPAYAYSIYFEHTDGTRDPAKGVDVTLNHSDTGKSYVVCALDTDGTVQQLKSSGQTTVTFQTNGSTYYILTEPSEVITEKESETETETETETDAAAKTGSQSNQKQVTSTAAKTADNTMILPWILLLLAAGSYILMRCRMRKN